MKKIIYFLAILLPLLSSCDIERLPKGSMDANKIVSDPNGSLETLLNGCYAQMKNWSDVMHRCGEYAGDNMMIRGTSTDSFYEFISYSRTPSNGRLQSFWDGGYKVIAQASNVIKMIEEGQSKESDNSIGECYFLRGMMYFYLCRAYGRPYYQDPSSNLGVPIVNGTPDDVLNLQLDDRSTVEQTYRQAIDDIKHAAELMSIDKGPAYASKEVAYSMLSRIYLYMSGKYDSPNTQYADSVVFYSSKVIESDRYALLPRNEFMKYNTIVPENNKESIFVIKRLASEFSGYDHFYGIGGMYANIGGMGWGEMYASAKYIDLLNETGRNDWRKGFDGLVDARAAFIEPQYTDEKKDVFRFIKDVYSLKKNLTAQDQVDFNYVQADIEDRNGVLYAIERGVPQYKYDGDELVKETTTDAEGTTVGVTKDIEYQLKEISKEQGVYEIEQYNTSNNLEPIYISVRGVVDNKMKLNRIYPMFYITKCSKEGEESHLHSPIVSRLAEIYLNRAEAYAKLGRYSDALADLNRIRERSLPGESYSSLDASNAAKRIDKERQLELAYQAERSYDVYRNGESLSRRYPGPHNSMEKIMPNDYRVVFFIPQDAINAYPGKLTQNPTSN